MEELKQTTKECSNCKNTQLLQLPSKNIKICTDCENVIPWYLENKQQPLVKAQR